MVSGMSTKLHTEIIILSPRYYAQGNVSQDQYIQFIRHDTLGFEYLDQSKNFAPQVGKESMNRLLNSHNK